MYRGKVVAKCYGYDRAVLHGAHKDGLCVPCQEGEEVEGGEEEVVVEDPNGVSIEQSAGWISACSCWEQPRGIFCCRGGGMGWR